MTHQEKMSDNIDKLEAIVVRMETVEKTYEQHFKMYKETIDKSLQLHDNRMTINDNRFLSLRNSLIGTFVFCLGLLFTGGVTMSTKVSFDSLKELDYTTKTEAIRGDQAVIDGIMDVIGEETDIDDFDLYNTTNDVKSKAYRGVTGEVNRSIE